MLFSEIRVKEPIDRIAGDWNFLHENVIQKFFGFRPVGDNVYGARSITLDAPQSVGAPKQGPMDLVKTRRNFELGPQGVVQVAREPLSVHVTRAGTPHHTEFLFGYWHINDKDEIIVSLPPAAPGEPAHLAIVMGFPKPNETDRMAWYCEQCTSLVHMSELHTGLDGFSRFWQWEKAAVREYNAEVKRRTCRECGHVNSVGYSAFPNNDSDEERAARAAW
jgi:hypothetical protein